MILVDYIVLSFGVRVRVWILCLEHKNCFEAGESHRSAKKEDAVKKKQIRNGKRKVATDVGAEAPKQMSKAYGLATIREQSIVVYDILDGDGVFKKGKN